MEESGCALEHPSAAKFRAHVISGKWDQVSLVITIHWMFWYAFTLSLADVRQIGLSYCTCTCFLN